MSRSAKPLRRALGLATTTLAFTVPVYLFAALGHGESPPRQPVPDLGGWPKTVAASVSVPGFRGAVPILAYRGVGTGEGLMAPRRFAEHMAALRAAGFHAITPGGMVRFMRGDAVLPLRPVLIVFTGALRSVWSDADPIMERFRMRGVVLISGTEVGTHRPYYLDRTELLDLVRSARWQVGSRPWRGDGTVRVRAGHAFGTAITNRAWIAAARRRETRGEYRDRMRADLGPSVRLVRSLQPSGPLILAYPVSVTGAGTNDPGLVAILRRLVGARAAAALEPSSGARFASRSDEAGALPAWVVEPTLTAAGLLRRIRAGVPLPARLAGLAGTAWVDGDGRPVPVRRRDGQEMLRLAGRARTWSAAYLAPDRTSTWRRYRVAVDVGDLGGGDSGATATLLLGASRGRGPGALAVSVSAGRVTIRRVGAPSALASVTVPVRDAHRLSATLGAGRVAVRVDGGLVAIRDVAPSVGGIGVGVWRSLPSSPRPSFTNLHVSS